MVGRSLNILKENSFFVFGARGVGKSTLFQQTFTPEESLVFNLLDPEVLETFSRTKAFQNHDRRARESRKSHRH